MTPLSIHFIGKTLIVLLLYTIMDYNICQEVIPILLKFFQFRRIDLLVRTPRGTFQIRAHILPNSSLKRSALHRNTSTVLLNRYPIIFARYRSCTANSSLSVRCSVTNVGAVINRPAVKCCDSTSIFGEFVIFYCRADDIRPYGVLSKTVRQTGILWANTVRPYGRIDTGQKESGNDTGEPGAKLAICTADRYRAGSGCVTITNIFRAKLSAATRRKKERNSPKIFGLFLILL